MPTRISGTTGITFNDSTVQSSAGLQSLQTNGYQILPSGLIMQWGYQSSVPADGGLDLTFPIPFTTAVLSLTATFTGNSSDQSPDYSIHTRNVTNTGFRLSNADQFGNRAAYWLAIGY